MQHGNLCPCSNVSYSHMFRQCHLRCILKDIYIVYQAGMILISSKWEKLKSRTEKLNRFIPCQWNPAEKEVLVLCESAMWIRGNILGSAYTRSYLTYIIFDRHGRTIYLILVELKAAFPFGKLTAWRNPQDYWFCFFLRLLAARAICFIIFCSSGELRFVYVFKCLLSFSCT